VPAGIGASPAATGAALAEGAGGGDAAGGDPAQPASPISESANAKVALDLMRATLT